MKIYQLTEQDKEALLKELELEKFKTPDFFCVTNETRQAQVDAVATMHKRFLYHVHKALS